MNKFNEKFTKINRKLIFRFLFVIIIFYLLFINLRSSAVFQHRDRINIVINDQDQIGFYSLGLSDNVNYFISLFPDLEVVVPGGYGYYRLGAIPKLASLEKKKDLFKKTYSILTSSFVDFYFYQNVMPDKNEIFFGKEKKDFLFPRFFAFFFGRSNAHLIERIILYLRFFGKTKGQFKIISYLPIEQQGNRKVFSSQEFFEASQGLFYQKTYRNEQLNVQIIYTKSYNTAKFLAQIMEGEGIRVVDITQGDDKEKKCEVREDKRSSSQTSRLVSNFFGCQLVSGKTGAYDIIFKLGGVEEEWEVE